MVMTSSTMLDLGTSAPDFSLPDVSSGQSVSLADFSDKKALLVMFICVHCPFVIHVKSELTRLGKDYANEDIAIVAISSNDIKTHPQDAPQNLAAMARELELTYPILFDESQDVAKRYTAACTPDFFLFGPDRKLVYRGQLDDSRPNSGKPITGKDLRAAIDALLADQPMSAEQIPSIGCNIKWRAGNEPSYFG